MEVPVCDIMHAYKLQDYDVEEWLTALWETKDNASFKSQVKDVPAMQKILAHIGSHYAEQQAMLPQTDQ